MTFALWFMGILCIATLGVLAVLYFTSDSAKR